MRVTKFVHSCLLVEHNDKAVLIDPGDYSWPSIDLEKLPKLDAILLTHIHHDHYSVEAIRQIRSHFPDSEVFTNAEVSASLRVEEIATTQKRPEWLLTNTAKHPVPPWAVASCQNTVFHLFGNLTHPGDSHTFKETRSVLALPITAPWGSMMDAINHAIKLRPKVVLPIHDWHWQEEARQDAYAKAKRALAGHGIEFLSLETGISVELQVG